MKYILAIDAGTTNSKCAIFDEKAEMIVTEELPFEQYYPNHGWVESKPLEIWQTQKAVIEKALRKSEVLPHSILGIGISNQRETTLVWDRETSEPLWNAIIWKDRRTKDVCGELKAKYDKTVQKKTGLVISSYFSASKIAWILDNVPGSRERAEKGELCFGTVNTWLLWKLTNGRAFKTDISNASRTLLFNIHEECWDDELLEIFRIPKAMLPEIGSCSEIYGEADSDLFPSPIPIASMIGDQQASLFGNACFKIGDAKCTFGTGGFLLVNTGEKIRESKNHLTTTVAWKIASQPTQYALEGSVYAAGSAISWLKNSWGIIRTIREIEGLAYSVPDSGGLYFVPSFSGLAAPYWDDHATASMFGITTGTNIGHLCRALIEGIAYQIADVLSVMQKDIGNAIKNVKCDGGMSENVFLMQIQSDLINMPIVRSANQEMTTLGAAFLAGLALGIWKDQKEIASFWQSDRKFTPTLSKQDVKRMRKNWRLAVKATQTWAKGHADP